MSDFIRRDFSDASSVSHAIQSAIESLYNLQSYNFTYLKNSLPFEADEFEITNYDSDDNPLTIVYRKDGATVATVNITYDANSNVLTYQVS